MQHSEHEWIDVVDDYMDKEYIHGLANVGIEPPIVLQPNGLESDIGERKRTKIILAQRMVRNYFRGKEMLFTLLYNLQFYIKIKLKK